MIEGHKAKFAAAVVLVGGFSILCWQALFPWLGTREGSYLSLIAALEQNQPIRSNIGLEGLLPCIVPPQYRESGSCDSENFRSGDVQIDDIDFRPQENGSILVLDKFGSQCLRLALISKKYPGGKTESACSHSYCPYYSVQRSWGRLSFGLGKSSEREACVESVVLESAIR